MDALPMLLNTLGKIFKIPPCYNPAERTADPLCLRRPVGNPLCREMRYAQIHNAHSETYERGRAARRTLVVPGRRRGGEGRREKEEGMVGSGINSIHGHVIVSRNVQS